MANSSRFAIAHQSLLSFSLSLSLTALVCSLQGVTAGIPWEQKQDKCYFRGLNSASMNRVMGQNVELHHRYRAAWKALNRSDILDVKIIAGHHALLAQVCHG